MPTRTKSWRRLVWPLAATIASVAVLFGYRYALDAIGSSEFRTDADGVIRLLAGASSYLSAAWLASRLVGMALARNGGGPSRAPKLMHELVSAGFFVAASLATIVFAFDGSVLGAAATSGVLIAVLGFSLRNVVADIFAGIALSLERSYRIGDWIEIGDGPRGRVLEINWRATRIETRDKVHVVVPNGQIAQERLTNFSVPQRHYRQRFQIAIDHSVPAERAKRLLTEAAKSADCIVRRPPPDARLVAYEPSGLVYVVRYWVPGSAQELDCRDAILSAIDRTFREERLPPPQRYYRMHMESEAHRPALREAA
jgi:small-conductance mechanosensitive channel